MDRCWRVRIGVRGRERLAVVRVVFVEQQVAGLDPELPFASMNWWPKSCHRARS